MQAGCVGGNSGGVVMQHSRVLALAMCALTFGAIPTHADALEKVVGPDWKWFTDYAYLTAEWTLNAESDCRLEAGLGIMAFGKPRGGRIPFSGYMRFSTRGIGAVHVRVVNGKGPCRVRLDQGFVEAIPITRAEFP